MWMLRLAFYDLWCFLRTRTALFLLLFLGCIAVMFFGFYEMTDWLDSLEIHEENNHITSGVEMDFSNAPLSLDAKRELMQILEHDWPEYTLYHAMGLPDGQQALVVGINLPPEKYLNARYGFSEGVFLSLEEIKQNSAKCVITRPLADYSENSSMLGRLIQLEGMELEIVGVYDHELYQPPDGGVWEAQVVVPAGLFKGENLSLMAVEMNDIQKPETEKLNTLSNWMEINAPGAQVRWPQELRQDPYFGNMIFGLRVEALSLMVSVVSLTALLAGWIYLSRKQWLAMFLCGASMGRLCALTALETAILAMMAAVPAIILLRCLDWLFEWATIEYRMAGWQMGMVVIAVAMLTSGISALRSLSVLRRLMERGRA